MTLQCEELDKCQQCEGNRDVVLKDDLQRRLKLKGWNGNMKLTLKQQNSNSACEIALNTVTTLQEKTLSIQISKK